MSRAFHPPDTLSKEDIRAVAEVRRDVWTNGMKGLLYGSITGYFSHTISKAIYTRMDDATKGKFRVPGSDTPIRLKFNRNTAFLSFMLGGALGSFAFATAAGKNQVHNMHDVFEVGKKEPEDSLSPYQRKVEDAKKDTELQEMDRRRRRLSRRENVAKRLEDGQGLSDSHGGHWLKDQDQIEERRRRLSRRKTVAKRIDEGRGLSDSHGGKWS